MRVLILYVVILASIFVSISCNSGNNIKPMADEAVDEDFTDTTTPDSDVVADNCKDGCLLSGICYPDGVSDPTNPCQKCDISTSNSNWTNNDSAACDDGKFCTENDRCSTGTCSGTVVDPDDKISCNGVEACDEENDSISTDKTQGQCEEDQICDTQTGNCVETCAGCEIEETCYGDGQINPLNICEKCDVATSRILWTDADGNTCDDGKFCTENDLCSASVCSGIAVDPDDGVACNGVESCDDENDGIVVDTTSEMCDENQMCDIEGNQCVDECPGCFIGGVCYGNGQVNPDNLCEKCDLVSSESDWSDKADNTMCDDGFFCTENDKCSAGVCGGTNVNPDDGIVCNGVESCDDENDMIESTGNQCNGEQVCDISSGLCVDTCPGCVIDSICYADKQVSPENLCSSCDILTSDSSWTDGNGTADNGRCSCDEGWEGSACTQKICMVLVKTDGDDAKDGDTWKNAKATIQAGITKAVTDGCDVWVKEGTYLEHVELVDNVKIYGSFAGTEVAPGDRVIPEAQIEGRNMPDPTTIIDGGGTDTVLTCFLSNGCGNNVLLDGLTITNGRNALKGGGMSNNQTAPTLKNCLFKNNSATEGGAMYNESASPVIINTRFTANQSFDGATNKDAYDGGAIYNNGSSMTFDNCVFDSNRAGNGGNGSNGYDNAGNPYAGNAYPGKRGGTGGVFYNKNSAIGFKNCFFFSNNAGNGGRGGRGGQYGYVLGGRGGNGGAGGKGGTISGINSEATFFNTVFLHNTSGRGGNGGNGGLGGTGGSGGHGGNAGHGGIIYNESSSSATLANCVVADVAVANGGNGGAGAGGFGGTSGTTGNGGAGGSGAIYSSEATAVLTSATVVNATAGLGGTGTIPGVAGKGGWVCSLAVSKLTISNSILWGGDIYSDPDSTAAVSYSDVEAGCSSFADIQCGDGNIDVDPEFANVAVNDFRLKDTSLCMDAGSNDLLPADIFDVDDDNNITETLPLDLNGELRVKDTTVDMGAYEKELVDPFIELLDVISTIEIEITFNEEVEQTAAETIDNYAIDNGITISAAVFDTVTKRKVVLTVDGFGQNDDYILTVNNVTDVSGNLIAIDTTENFSIADLRPHLLSVEITSVSSVKLIFDKELDEITSQVALNYTVAGLTVDSATLELTEKKDVTLTFTPDIDPEVTYSVVVNGITSSTGFEIRTDSSALFDKLPAVDSLTVISGTKIEVVFSEQVDKTIAETVENYEIDNGVSVISALLEETENKKITLTIDSFGESNDYILTVNNIEDLEGNHIESDTEENFNITSYQLEISSVEVLTPTSLKLTFNNEVEQILAETVENYTVDGLTVESATLELTGNMEVTLVFTSDILSETYTLYVNGLFTTLGFEIVPDTSVEFEKPLPQSCSDIVEWGDSVGNGSYTIYHNGVEARDWTVDCLDMGGTPIEFLTLINTGGNYNFSRYAAGGSVTGSDLYTFYQKLRINPETLIVSVDDRTFSLTTGGPLSNSVEHLSYGSAVSCITSGDSSGTGNINLVGTNLKVVSGAFITQGWNPAGDAVYSSNNQIVSITGGGSCGETIVVGGELQLEIIE